MRAFIALPVPDDVADAAGRLQAMLPTGRPVAPDALHLTLAFLDDQPEPVLQDLHFELDTIRAAPLTLRFTGLDIFGGPRPRILMATIAPDAGLDTLHRQVSAACRRAGITLQRRKFHPHVTLARFGPADSPAALSRFLTDHGATPLPDCHLTEFALIASTLHPDGARYDDLARYPLH